MDSDVQRRLQTFVDELEGIAEQKQLPFQLGFITTTSTQPIHDDAVWKVAESFVQPVLAKQKDELRLYHKPIRIDPFPDGSACIRWAGDEGAILAYKDWARRFGAFLSTHNDVCSEVTFQSEYHRTLQQLALLARSTPALSSLIEQKDLTILNLADTDSTQMGCIPKSVTQQQQPSFAFQEVLCVADIFATTVVQFLMGEPKSGPRLIVDPIDGTVTLDGIVYGLDGVYIAIVEILVWANGFPVARSVMRERHALLKDEDRLDRKIKGLRKECPKVGELISKGDHTGFSLPPEYLAQSCQN
jgi:hypothetical protein